MTNTLTLKRLFVQPFENLVPALFLDRDGVIIEDCHYIRDPIDVRLCPGALNVIAAARRAGWAVVIITNQSGIARGYFNWDDVQKVNNRMIHLLGPDAEISAIYANGHGPNALSSTWRKPSPLMILQAAVDLNIDLDNSVLIGDRLSDMQAGAAAHLLRVFHVLTGHGHNSRKSVINWHNESLLLHNGETPDSVSCPGLTLLDTLTQFPLSIFTPNRVTPNECS